METIAGLIRQFPEGSFILILAFIWACERAVSSFFNRNRPSCDCDCCGVEDDEEEEED